MALNNNLKDSLSPKLSEDLEFEFEELDSKQSIKTNYLLVNKNFKKLGVFLKKLVNYVESLSESIKLENIVNDVITEINDNKTNIVIRPDIGMNQSVIIGGFIVTRNDKDIYRIEKQKGEWNTSNLMVQVKEEISGAFTYPSIETKDNYIELYFVKGIYTNIKVIII